MGVLTGLFATLLFGLPVVGISALLCTSPCQVDTVEFLMVKAVMASILGLVFFPLAALRVLAVKVHV